MYVPSPFVLCAGVGADLEWKRKGVGAVDGSGIEGKDGVFTGPCIRYNERQA